MKYYQLYKEQKINASIEEIWKFISAPQNLKDITPPYMGFDITSKNLPEVMYPGMIITYKVSPVLGEMSMLSTAGRAHFAPMTVK